MNDLVRRLDAYIRAHPIDPGDSSCKTVLDQLYQAYDEFHQNNPAELGAGLLP